MIDYPNKLDRIFEKLDLLNIKPIIVGGYIRDYLIKTHLNQEKKPIDHTISKDIDIELYGISSLNLLEEALAEFGSVNSVGKSFGVCKLSYNDLDLDFSLPRLDSKISSGHKGFKIKTPSNINFKEAAFRRDFTINTIGYDVKNKKLLDPYGGLKDLQNRTLNAVDSRSFVEDPLRVLRAVQFAARFDFNLSEDTFLLCQNMLKKEMLNELSKERIFDEIKKLLLKSDKPSLGFKLLRELGGLNYFHELKTLSQEDWNFTLNALDNMSSVRMQEEKTNIVLMLSTLCYKLSSSNILTFLSSLTRDKEILSKVLALTQNRLKTKMSNSELYRLAQYLKIEESLTLHCALYENNKNLYNLVKIKAKKLGVLNKKLEPLFQGRDLLNHGLSPSKEFSEILSLAYEAQMDEKFKNREEATKWLNRELLS